MFAGQSGLDPDFEHFRGSPNDCWNDLYLSSFLPCVLPFENSELVSLLALCVGVVRVAKAHSKSLIDPSVCKHCMGRKEASERARGFLTCIQIFTRTKDKNLNMVSFC